MAHDVSILGFGDNVVDVYEHTGTMYPGGNAVNVAVAAKRCGAARSAYLGHFGSDAAAEHMAVLPDAVLQPAADKPALVLQGVPLRFLSERFLVAVLGVRVAEQEDGVPSPFPLKVNDEAHVEPLFMTRPSCQPVQDDDHTGGVGVFMVRRL